MSSEYNVSHVLQSGDQEAAISTYDRALELDRRNVDAHVARGAAFANQRDFARAIADFEAALGQHSPCKRQDNARDLTKDGF